MEQYYDYSPPLRHDKTHSEAGSVSIHPLLLEANELSGLAADIAPSLNDILTCLGCEETHTGLRDIRLTNPGNFASPTYRSLLDVPMHFARVQMVYDTTWNTREPLDTKIILRNSGNNGCAELSSSCDDQGQRLFYIQQASTIENLPTGVMERIDDRAVQSILTDLLLQSGYNPSKLQQIPSLDEMLAALVQQSKNYLITKQATYGWSVKDAEDKICGSAEAEIIHRVERTSKKDESSYRIAIRTTQPLGNDSTQGKIQLAFEVLPYKKDPSATLLAGIGNTTLAAYNLPARNALLDATANQYYEPGTFTSKVRGSIAHLISPFSEIKRVA